MTSIWIGPPMERSRVSKHEPASFCIFLRLEGVWGPRIAQVYGHSIEEVTHRARLVRLALEQKEAVS